MYQSSKEFLKALYEDMEQPNQLEEEATPLTTKDVSSSATSHSRPGSKGIPVTSPKKNKLSLRVKLVNIFLLLLVPFVIYFGGKLTNRNYLAVSVMLLIIGMVPFFFAFEDRKPSAKELVLLAVLVGIAVVGRGIFFMLPQFKPMAAIVIISAVSLGAETGFLVGCLSALISNMFFSQGPWTPWQMFAFGMVGFVAGLIFHRRKQVSRLELSLFGFISIFLIYGLIMNPASVIMYTSDVTFGAVITSFVSGAPMDLIHGGSTAIFLFILADPFLKKLERIKQKHDII
ncbi:ECF transporter S component [Vagococcus humatus]|uniref:ECF transporter S component n=1 Tax=Vagococcus humatus TaxID=1889241 RepID=A0A3S0AWW5_9ENTE|nr:ECF transporter S component [Vagococcus humatus]RST89035.1 ECF transporter S component [Vagococcus humatus]